MLPLVFAIRAVAFVVVVVVVVGGGGGGGGVDWLWRFYMCDNDFF